MLLIAASTSISDPSRLGANVDAVLLSRIENTASIADIRVSSWRRSRTFRIFSLSGEKLDFDDAENRVEIAGFLAEACHEQLDYQGEYEAAWQAVAALAANRHPVSREIRRALYVRAANAALTMGDYPRALETFRQAEEYSDSLAEKNRILGSLLLTAHYTGMDSQQLFELHSNRI